MSWIRWGSPCQAAGCIIVGPCHPGIEKCPGSDVYVWEASDNLICCGCEFSAEGRSKDEAREFMREHLREHVKAGDHVPLALYDDGLKSKMEKYFDAIGWVEMDPHDRIDWYEAHKYNLSLSEFDNVPSQSSCDKPT